MVDSVLKQVSKMMAEDTSPELRQQLQLEFRTQVIQQQMLIKQWHNKYLQVQSAYRKQTELYMTEGMERTAARQTAQNWIEQTYRSKKKEYEKRLGEYMWKGYELVQSFRAAITNRKITYTIGFQDGAGENSKIYNIQVSDEQLYKLLYPDYASRGQGINLRFSKNKVKQLIESLNERTDAMQAEDKLQLANRVSSGGTLYSQMARFYYNQPPKTNKLGQKTTTRIIAGKAGRNEGNFYEAYMYLYRLHGTNEITVTEEEIVQALLDVGGNTRFSQAGDVGSEQIKFVGQSAASITTSKTIINALQQVKQFMNYLITGTGRSRFEKAILQWFLDPKYKNKMDEQEYHIAAENLTKNLRNMGIQITLPT